MKSNFGSSKCELIVSVTLIIVIFLLLSRVILRGKSNWKFVAMKEDSFVLLNTISVNSSSFSNSDVIYLKEAIDEGVIGKIRNPVGDGFCSETESFVRFDNGKAYVTLKCGNYLVDNFDFSSKKMDFYKVSRWIANKDNDSLEERKLYNCYKDGQMVFDAYYDKSYFIYKLNKKFKVSGGSLDDMSLCKVVVKAFYRKKEKVRSLKIT